MSEAAAPSEVGHPGQLQEHQVWEARPEGSSGASGGNGFMHPLKILRKCPKYQAQDLVQGLVLPPRSSSLEISLLHATCTSRYSKWNWVDLVHLGIFRLFLFSDSRTFAPNLYAMIPTKGIFKIRPKQMKWNIYQFSDNSAVCRYCGTWL